MAAFTISLGLPRKQFRGSRIPLVEEAWSSYLSKGKSKHLESATCAAPVLCGLYLLNHFTRMISLGGRWHYKPQSADEGTSTENRVTYPSHTSKWWN